MRIEWGGGGVMWKQVWPFLQDEKNQRALTLIGGGLAVVIGGVWAAFVYFFRAPEAKPAMIQDVSGASFNSPQVNIRGGENVVSVGQIGGIAARVVTINPPLRPELRILGKTEVDNPDGSHRVAIKTEVASPITPGLLIVQIDAVGIQRVSIVPPATNGISSMLLRNVRQGPNSYSAEIPAPRGRYDIVVQTNSAVPMTLKATF